MYAALVVHACLLDSELHFSRRISLLSVCDMRLSHKCASTDVYAALVVHASLIPPSCARPVQPAPSRIQRQDEVEKVPGTSARPQFCPGHGAGWNSFRVCCFVTRKGVHKSTLQTTMVPQAASLKRVLTCSIWC